MRAPATWLLPLLVTAHAFSPAPTTWSIARTSHRTRAPATPRLNLLDWLEQSLLERRQRKQLAKRPKRIILVRHGQSEGNVDDTVYSSVPDSQIALTERGFAQAVVAGLQIRQLVGNESVRCFYSPYLRAQQTMLAILQAFDSQTVQISSEPRLREQDFGNFQNPEAMGKIFAERQKFGRFYYRFPNGEAGTDVFDRMASFITYLFRTMTDTGYFAGDVSPGQVSPGADRPAGYGLADNYLLITHGLLMRIFCMCYLRWTVTEFEQARLPPCPPPPGAGPGATSVPRAAAPGPEPRPGRRDARRCGTRRTARSGCWRR